MVTLSPSSSFSTPYEPCNYEEYSIEQSLFFSDNLKDLKNLRSQLYTAAEYFEVSYTNDDQKQTVANTLKDYTINALVNTVDHLGSVAYKVTDFLDEKADEVSGTELRVSCIEQRLRTCQECIDHEGLSQQSLAMTTPKYHKRYILPVDGTMHGSEHNVSKSQGCYRDDEDDWNHLANGVQTTIRGAQQSTIRKGISPSPSPQPSSQPGSYIFTGKTDKQKLPEKRTASPVQSKFPLLHSGFLSSRPSSPHYSRSTTPTRSRPITPTQSRPTTPTRSRPITPTQSRPTTPTPTRPKTPTPSRPTTPKSFDTRLPYPSNSRKLSSTHLHAQRGNHKEIEQYPSKSKRIFKALLSRRKAKQDDTLYTYLDEY